MFIPYRVDVPFNHRPVMNWLLVASIIITFLATFVDLGAYQRFFLDGWNIKGLFGYMWLHVGLFHLLGNLLFLWLFGNAICSKVGNIFYLPIYIGLGLIAAASHLIFSDARVIGASGAINGIVGMYLVFFPENNISCFFLLFFRPIFFTISGFWMILLWFAFDIFGALRGSGGVAYIAHVGGFLGGFGLAVLMLKFKWIQMERDEKSIFEMLLRKKKASNIPKEELEFWRKELKKSKSKKPKDFTSSLRPEKTKVDHLYFKCSCGQKIKVPIVFAGKKGRCPKCKVQLNIPDT